MNAVQSLYRDQLEESLADYRRHKGCFSTHQAGTSMQDSKISEKPSELKKNKNQYFNFHRNLSALDEKNKKIDKFI